MNKTSVPTLFIRNFPQYLLDFMDEWGKQQFPPMKRNAVGMLIIKQWYDCQQQEKQEQKE